MKKYLLPFLFLVFSSQLFSQVNQFQITYGTSITNWSAKAIPTSDGGYVLMMDDVTNPLLRDIALIKLDSIGNILWTRTYGNSTNTDDYWSGIIEAHNGGYLISGILNAGTNQVGVWIRTDSNGDTVWVKSGLGGYNIIKTADGGYAHVGAGLLKTDSMGNIQWRKSYKGAGGSPSYGQQTSDRGYIVVGLTQQYASGGPTDRDFMLFKTDSVGDLQWSKVYERPTSMEYVSKVVQANDGGFVILGTTAPGNQYSAFDLILIKTDTAGNLQWTKTYGGVNHDRSADLKATGAIGYIITGYTEGFEGPIQNSARSFLLRTDGSGNPVWTKMYGDMANNVINSNDEAAHVSYTSDGGFLLSGSTESYGVGLRDVWLVKTDATGTSGCNEVNNNPTVNIPIVTVAVAGYDSSLIITSSPYTVVMGAWQPTKTILCLNGSLTSETENPENENDILIYPNPSNGIFTIKMEDVTGLADVEIYNVMGEKVFTSHISHLTSVIDLSAQAKGIYFVKVQSGEKVSTQKIIIE